MPDASQDLVFAEQILETIQQPFLILDRELRVERTNKAFLQHFHLQQHDTVGKFIHELGSGQWDVPELRRILESVLTKDERVEDYRVELNFEHLGACIMLINANPVRRSPHADSVFVAINDVTERERYRFHLEGQLEFSEKLIDSIREALLVLTSDMKVQSANAPFYELFEVIPEETVGRYVHELGSGQWNIPGLRHLLEEILPEKQSFDDYEIEQEFPHIGRRTMSLNARHLNHLNLIILAIRDVTAEQETERARSESEAHHRLLVELADALRDLTKPRAVTEAASALLGQHLRATQVGYAEVDEPANYGLVEMVWNDGSIGDTSGQYRLADFGPELVAALKQGETIVVNDIKLDRRTNSPGAIKAFESISTVACISVPLVKAGELKALLSVGSKRAREWTKAEIAATKEIAERTWAAVERARSEKALRRSEQRLRLASEAAGFGIYEFDVTRRTSYWSPGLQRIMGHNFGDREVPFEAQTQIIHPDDRPRVTARMALAVRHPGQYELEFRIVRADGSIRWVLDRGEAFSPLDPDTGLAHRGAGTVIDISERKAVEDALRRSEERLRLSQEAGRVGVWEWDIASGEIYWSDQAKEIFCAEDIASPDFEIWKSRVHPDDLERAIAQAEAALKEEVYADDYRVVAPDGSHRWIRVSGQVTRDEDSDSTVMRGVAIDVTARKQQEHQIQLLAGEVNHRAKNLLTVVQAIAAETARDAKPTEFAMELMNRLQGLSASQDLIIRGNWSAVSVAQLVDSQLRHLGSAMQRVRRIGDGIVVSPAAAQAIGMALHELATNAIKYGALSNRTGQVEISWQQIDRADGPRIVFCWVESNGPPVQTPKRRGFGRSVIEDMAAYSLDAEVELEYLPDGVRWRLDAPASKVLGSPLDSSAASHL